MSALSKRLQRAAEEMAEDAFDDRVETLVASASLCRELAAHLDRSAVRHRSRIEESRRSAEPLKALLLHPREAEEVAGE